MLYWPLYRNCYCTPDAQGFGSTTCAPASSIYIYYHPPGPQASGYSKRRQLATVRRAVEEDTSLCPVGKTACQIEGWPDSHEVRLCRSRTSSSRPRADVLSPPSHAQCLDTETELESCGGCRHGVFSAPSRRLLRRVGMAPLMLHSPTSLSLGLPPAGVE